MADTEVITPDGAAPIQDIQVGDEVLCRVLDGQVGNSSNGEVVSAFPTGMDLVAVVGAGPRLVPLGTVPVGQRVVFEGRILEVTESGETGQARVRWDGDVVGKVVRTFVRTAPQVIAAELERPDGSRSTLTGTPNHPFWVPAVRDYVPLGQLEVGAVLHVQGGGEAILVSKTWRQGDFEVFDFEVEGLHNFYVRGSGSDAAGVLVHNSTVPQGDGVVYRRTDPATGDKYIGQSKSPERFQARQREHDRALGTKHDYDVVDRAEPGLALDVAEESAIRLEGGLQREGGALSNKRHQMSEKRYRDAGGTVDDPNK